jgi:hypothetical protein
MANGAWWQNGTVSYRNTSWNPSTGASVTFGAGGSFRCANRMALMSAQTVTLSDGAGSVCFGGDTGGSANYIGVDNVTTNANYRERRLARLHQFGYTARAICASPRTSASRTAR